jgi:hypothetical protein
MLPFSSGEKQLIPQSISINDLQKKASKEMTVMAIKHRIKHHTSCGMDFGNGGTMLTATKYPSAI